MKEPGKRLRDERERLGLTQEAFATACGVGRRAQVAYESDERSPDSRYLEAAGKIGVDVGYVVIGLHASDDLVRSLANEVVLGHIARGLDIDGDKLRDLLNEAEEEERRNRHGQPFAHDATYIFRRSQELLAEALRKLEIDSALLSSVLEGIENASGNLTIPAAKKAKLAAMLYRSFKASGKIDQRMIEEAITLAAS